MSILTQLFEYVLQHSTQANAVKVLVALSAYYVYKYRGHAIGTRRRPDLKEPKGAVPLLGHLPLMASVPLTEFFEFLEKQNNELGPVWSISIPGFGRIVQVDTVENLEYLAKTNFWNFGRGPSYKVMLKDLLGYDGIFTSEGTKWKLQRHIASNIFNINAFREFTSDVFVVIGKKVLNHLAKAADEGTVIDFQRLMFNFTLDAFGAVMFGDNFGLLDNNDVPNPFAVAIDDMLEGLADRVKDPLWKISERLNGTSKRVARNKEVLRGYCQNYIDKRRKEGLHSGKTDLLQLFLEGKDENGQSMPDSQVAGRDTTAQSLTWMFYLLLRDGTDPEILRRLDREVVEVLGGESPTYETHKKLKYTEACFNEALRVFPPIPRNLRYCESDDVLPDGTKVYAGEWVVWSSYVMGRSESIWGPDAKEYKPSRWLNTEKPSPAKATSFHVGPRACIGQQFAVIEVLTMTSMIFQSFSLEMEDPSKPPKYKASMGFPMEGGLKLRVNRRFGATAI
ncbi:hypothetical protein BGZ80_008712 [Entomortierella chlamydospora]|uniref:Cytochrome P450 n=1 Tax=Entomortierella chlamydospora TaxID=101097 RepID=A0A9P6T0X2_9FUNG|nr:hypothetical protein BGZ79_006520 [Entomortierella chlamydospora]KAG0016992.1 hypothetical protein BGZ80_008712 [Entomortierella chlamydospora]